MALHLTKVAYGITSLDALRARLSAISGGDRIILTTRNQPKRHEEIAGEGSLYWIIKHQLVARSPILGFAEADGGRCAIILDPELIQVVPHPKRAHQGWRYLEEADIPVDAGSGELAELPPELAGKLAELGF